MEEKRLESQASQEEPHDSKTPDPQNAVEKVYENFRNVPVKYLDIFIGLCLAGLAAVLIIGFLQSRGIL